MMFKRKGGGGQRPFEQCSKKLHFSYKEASLIRYGDKRKRLGSKTTALQDNLFVRSIFLRPLGPPSTHRFLSLPLQTNRTFHW